MVDEPPHVPSLTRRRASPVTRLHDTQPPFELGVRARQCVEAVRSTPVSRTSTSPGAKSKLPGLAVEGVGVNHYPGGQVGEVPLDRLHLHASSTTVHDTASVTE